MPPATFYILLALAEGEKHGYAIMKQIGELSDGRVEIGPATLYTNIQRLVDHGWIAPVKSAKGEDPRRRYYRISPSGLAALREELGHMEAVVRKTKALRLKPSRSA